MARGRWQTGPVALTVVLLVVALLTLWLSASSRIRTPCTPEGGSATVVALHARVESLQDELRRILMHQTDPLTVLAPPRLPCPSCPSCPASHPAAGTPVHDDGASSHTTTSSTAAVPWLSIVVPTVPRKGSAVLTSTLESIDAAIRGTSFEQRVKVVVVNNRPGKHDAFDAARSKYHARSWFAFHENVSPVPEPPHTPLAPEFASKHQEAPTAAVLRQTLDVAGSLRYAIGGSQYALLYEDDFHLCRGALLALQHMIDRAHKYSGTRDGWAAIRCSFGLAGIVLQNGAGGAHPDLERFQRYLVDHSRRRPPDHLAVEFYGRESSESKSHFDKRHNFGFRHNILRHDGHVSTLREQSPWAMPGCFTELVEPVIFAVEAWSKTDCPDDDMWPCPNEFAEPPSIAWREASA